MVSACSSASYWSAVLILDSLDSVPASPPTISRSPNASRRLWIAGSSSSISTSFVNCSATAALAPLNWMTGVCIVIPEIVTLFSSVSVWATASLSVFEESVVASVASSSVTESSVAGSSVAGSSASFVLVLSCTASVVFSCTAGVSSGVGSARTVEGTTLNTIIVERNKLKSILLLFFIMSTLSFVFVLDNSYYVFCLHPPHFHCILFILHPILYATVIRILHIFLHIL